MAEYALVDSGVVQQVIVADGAFITTHGADVATTYGYPSATWEATPAPSSVGIGYTYSNSIYLAPMLATLAVAAGDSFTLGVSGSSLNGPLTYQWKKNSVDISGATSSTYTVGSAGSGDTASYTCTVSDGSNSLTSGACAVTVS